MKRPIKHIKLENEMEVLIREDHRAPAASFYIWYRVGGRNELPGLTGISHLVEHMLFKGTPEYPAGQLDRLITARGGRWNGFTGDDYTAFFEVLPPEHIQLAIEIEADRMVNCAFSPEEIDRERGVILSEREGSENDPSFWLAQAVRSTAFTAHPYGHMVIGRKSDIQDITREQLLDHYHTYYTPKNAVAVVVGDIDTSEIEEIVRENFGQLQPGPQVTDLQIKEPPQQGPRRITVSRPGRTRRLRMVYHIPSAAHPDIVPLHVLQAILSGGTWPFGFDNAPMGKSSRLYTQLIHENIAVGASSLLHFAQDPHLFNITLMPAPQTENAQAEHVVEEILNKLAEKGASSEELTRAKKQVLAQYAYSEGVASLGSALGALSIVADWRFCDDFPSYVQEVTSQDIQRVAKEYLHQHNKTTGWFIPENAQTDSDAAVFKNSDLQPDAVHGYRDGKSSSCAGSCGSFEKKESSNRTLPGPQDIYRTKLPGNVTFIGYQYEDCQLYRCSLLLQAGSMLDPGDKNGAFFLIGDLLNAGTDEYDSQQLALSMDSLGMSFTTSVSTETTTLSIQSLPEDRKKALRFLAEMLLNASFPPEEIKKSQGRLATFLNDRKDNTAFLANRALKRMIYTENHPYRDPVTGTVESIKNLTRDDLMQLFSEYYQPDGAILVTVSDAPPSQMAEEITNILNEWLHHNQDAPRVNVDNVAPPEEPTEIHRRALTVTGKSQTDVVLGAGGVPRSHPDYDALRLAFLLLGGVGLGGRIGRDLRDREGLAYNISSRLSAIRGGGTWAIKAGVNPQNVETLLQGVADHLQRLSTEPPSGEELDEVKSHLMGSAQLSLETTRGLVTNLLNIEYYQLGLDYLSTYDERFASITPEDVTSTFARHVRPDAYFAATAGPPPQD